MYSLRLVELFGALSRKFLRKNKSTSMKNLLFIIIFTLSANSLFAQFYVGRHYSVIESQINQGSPHKVNILNAPLEYDAIGGFTGHKIQYTQAPFIMKTVVEVNASGIITECICYIIYNTQNKDLSNVVEQERRRIFAKYRSLNGNFSSKDDYTKFVTDSFVGVICTDRNKPFVHYEGLKSEFTK